MEVGSVGKSKGNRKDKGNGEGKEAKLCKQDKACFVCGKKGRFTQDCWSRIHQDITVNEVEGADVDADAKNNLCSRLKNSQRCKVEPKWLRKSRRRVGDDQQRNTLQRLFHVIWRICP